MSPRVDLFIQRFLFFLESQSPESKLLYIHRRTFSPRLFYRIYGEMSSVFCLVIRMNPLGKISRRCSVFRTLWPSVHALIRFSQRALGFHICSLNFSPTSCLLLSHLCFGLRSHSQEAVSLLNASLVFVTWG